MTIELLFELFFLGFSIFSILLFAFFIIALIRTRINPELLLPLMDDPNSLFLDIMFNSQNQINETKQTPITEKELSILPKIQLTKEHFQKMENFLKNQLEGRCCICLEKFNEGDNITTLPCFHIFHSSCIQTWLNMNKVCPLCKTWK
ncbi:target of erk kinase mpk-1 [Anaeramoeba ignava]|uniref:RING-type E3 ubiquitin transferase n=1 Tax=Anaeramoeba ignava TaxID=1746090 RepID=A0A9Q0RDM4_ANAIG|nr:target of erk kinase mpk-1 [Anaeramoeba ignava]